MRSTRVGLPQTDILGLSEVWLFEHCGEAHWAGICDAYGVPGVTSERFVDERQAPMYPAFVAVSARFDLPLADVRMDQEFLTHLALRRFGRGIFASEADFHRGPHHFRLRMLTAFVSRVEAGRNELAFTLPSPDLSSRAEAAQDPPELLRASRSFRRGSLDRYEILGLSVPLHGPVLGKPVSCEPSPYLDFNGVGLLYFAVYPGIVDTAERRIFRDCHLELGDRALSTSTIARDVYYHRNVELGDEVAVELRGVLRSRDRIATRTQLRRQSDSQLVADVVTVKQLLCAPGGDGSRRSQVA